MTPRDANRHARNALTNLLLFPGLGSLRSGRWLAGCGQVILVLGGSALIFLWLVKELSQYYGLMFGDEQPKPVGWIGETGAALFVLGWLWAGVTSISLFREASKAAAPPPPILVTEKMKQAERKIQAELATLPAWKRSGQVISRTFEFKDFPAAMKFVNAVAELAEQAQHHPDIDVRWNRVTLALTTHDAGGLTEKDFALARLCDERSLR
jgi:4a-hydroxytetrahydrobiopterin dehydratase